MVLIPQVLNRSTRVAAGEVAVVTLAAAQESMDTRSGVKGSASLCSSCGQHRSFLDIHVARSRRVSFSLGDRFRTYSQPATSHEPIRT